MLMYALPSTALCVVSLKTDNAIKETIELAGLNFSPACAYDRAYTTAYHCYQRWAPEGGGGTGGTEGTSQRVGNN
jgi:hypothetical protein